MGMLNLQEKQERIQKQIDALTRQLDRLTDMYLTQRIDEKAYDKKKLTIENELVELQSELKYVTKNNSFEKTFELAKKALESFVDNKKSFQELDNEAKRKAAFSVLSNFTLKDRKIVNLQYNSPYQVISKSPQNADFETLRA